ncbi:MAG: hypothetical protein ACTHNB_10065, partial [Gaiellaceae bacterium]
ASAYLDAYNKSGQTRSNGEALVFETLAVAPVGISIDAFLNAFHVSDAGTYLINVVLPSSTAAFSVQLAVNNTPAESISHGVSFSRILSLSAGDVITVPLSTAAPSVLLSPGAGITIVRIS